MGAITLSGCSSSSEVVSNDEISADELPVVDAQTDALPDSLDGPIAENTAPAESPTADGLQPEASVDMPAAAEYADVPAAEEAPTFADAPASSPSYDAPPSMNEVAPVATSPAPAPAPRGGGDELYEVQTGDTLMKIAFKVYGDVYQWRKVLNANSDRISDPALLVKGTQLRVDNAASDEYYNGFERYLIKSGDTLGYISTDVYGTKTKWKKLWKMNDGLVKDPNRIYAGFFLRYTMTEEERHESERTKSSHPAPLAETTEDAVRNPSSFQEAKVPSTPTQVTQ